MKSIEPINSQSNRTLGRLLAYDGYSLLKHILFWVLVFLGRLMANWEMYGSLNESLLTGLYRLIFQIATAYIFLFLILPRYEKKKSKVELFAWSFLLLVVVHTIYRIFKVTYFEVVYPDSYTYCQERYAGWTLVDRLLNIKGLIFKGPVIHFLPALLLIAWRYFQKQQKIIAISEQKKTAELNVLKNQLNPHFLFNTLNNLYALARKKSDKTPEAIGKLSEILDYTLYGCNDNFVPVSKEVDLIHNYLELENIRYGERADVRFTNDIQHQKYIAPLLFLTFLENAFKHGVIQELNQAIIRINLRTTDDGIVFLIKNSIPKNIANNENESQGIGLMNIRKQLNLLYQNNHELIIKEEVGFYYVELKINTNDI